MAESNISEDRSFPLKGYRMYVLYRTKTDKKIGLLDLWIEFRQRNITVDIALFYMVLGT